MLTISQSGYPPAISKDDGCVMNMNNNNNVNLGESLGVLVDLQLSHILFKVSLLE